MDKIDYNEVKKFDSFKGTLGEISSASVVTDLFKPHSVLTRGDIWGAGIYISCSLGLLLTFYYQDYIRDVDWDLGLDSIMDSLISLLIQIPKNYLYYAGIIVN